MKILIVDDEIDTLNEINYYVKEYGRFNYIVTCINPLEALKEAKKINFDIALLDIEMPGMSGLDLAEQLLNSYENIRIAFITAYNSYATEAFDVNAIDYVLKPIREERLIRALDRLAGKKTNENNLKEDENKLHIQTFGKFIIKVGDNTVKWNRKKAPELFAYLLENRGIPVHKEKLCDILWPDLEPKKALINLQSIMYTIRKAIREYDIRGINIKYANDNYLLNIEKVNMDIIEFENTLGKGINSNDSDMLKNAIGIYKGDYLEEEGWIWAEVKREQLRRKYIETLDKIHSRN